MTQNTRFDELLWTISRCCGPLGPEGRLEDRVRKEAEAINSLREEDIPIVFDLIGYIPSRKFWLAPDEFDGWVTCFLSILGESFPNQFLTTLEQRIGSIPIVLPLIDVAEDVDRVVGRAICELVSTRRCLSSTERALLKERCATVGGAYHFGIAAPNPAWLTSDVLALAQGIYDDKAFDRMPILADALQDAGCDSDDILNHCRNDVSHVRGCWVVDLMLDQT